MYLHDHAIKTETCLPSISWLSLNLHVLNYKLNKFTSYEWNYGSKTINQVQIYVYPVMIIMKWKGFLRDLEKHFVNGIFTDIFLVGMKY